MLCVVERFRCDGANEKLAQGVLEQTFVGNLRTNQNIKFSRVCCLFFFRREASSKKQVIFDLIAGLAKAQRDTRASVRDTGSPLRRQVIYFVDKKSNFVHMFRRMSTIFEILSTAVVEQQCAFMRIL